jgi:FtsP/CotA-like multicopper oxidase with cupredoxin domain
VTSADAANSKAMQQQIVDYTAQLKNGMNTKGVGNQPLAPTVLPDGTKQFSLTTKIVDWEVEPGKTVKAWTYNGQVPGPLIKVADGDKVQVVVKNELPQSTSVHWHGIEVPNAMDGVPYITQDPIKPGKTFTYSFVAHGPAVGMYHSHDYALGQVPNGLAGAFIVGDEPLPSGYGPVSQELPMVLNDAGVIGFSLNGKSFPATAPIIANVGETVEIHYINEGQQIHPMHLHGVPQLVIAKDGFALPNPYMADTVLVAPGERYTVLVRPTEAEKGVWAYHCHILSHAEKDDGMMYGMVTAFIVQ